MLIAGVLGANFRHVLSLIDEQVATSWVLVGGTADAPICSWMKFVQKEGTRGHIVEKTSGSISGNCPKASINQPKNQNKEMPKRHTHRIKKNLIQFPKQDATTDPRCRILRHLGLWTPGPWASTKQKGELELHSTRFTKTYTNRNKQSKEISMRLSSAWFK